MQNMTIKDIESMAKNIPNSGVLIQTLEQHPDIDFESIVVTGNGLDYEYTTDDMLELDWAQ